MAAHTNLLAWRSTWTGFAMIEREEEEEEEALAGWSGSGTPLREDEPSSMLHTGPGPVPDLVTFLYHMPLEVCVLRSARFSRRHTE